MGQLGTTQQNECSSLQMFIKKNICYNFYFKKRGFFVGGGGRNKLERKEDLTK